MENKILCPKCKIVAKKNGFIKGKQRFKCRSCNYQFTSQDKIRTPKRLSFEDKLNVLYFENRGLSYRKISKETSINRTTVIQITSNPLLAFQKEYIISDKGSNVQYIGVHKLSEIGYKAQDIVKNPKNILVLKYGDFLILFEINN
jgi:hypothetical protein